MDIIYVLLISMAVIFPFSIVGRQVQRITKFIVPIDFFTVAMYITLVCVGIFMRPLTEWVIPAGFGFALGYVLSARKEWKMVLTLRMDLPKPKISIHFIIPYQHKGKWCIQKQTWKDLGKRLFFDVHHYLETNTATNVDTDADLEYKRPYLPVFEDKVIVAAYFGEKEPEEVKRKKRTFLQHTTECLVADPLLSHPLERITKAKSYIKDMRAMNRMRTELIKVKEDAERGFRDEVANTIQAMVVDATPASNMRKYAQELKAKEEKKEEKKEDEDGSKE